VTGAAGNGVARTGGDWRIGGWSSARMVAPSVIGAWNWLSADGIVVEAAVVAVGGTGTGETDVAEASVGEARIVGVGDTGAEGVENLAGEVEARVGTMENGCTASAAA